MTIATVTRANTDSLPQALRTAQAAMHFPDVQEMLRKLSEYKLGIFMPHMHDEQTGDFQPLPDELVQVESGLEVSFQSSAKMAQQTDRFLPVGWVWRAGATTPVAACEMDDQDKTDGAGRTVKHKMVRASRPRRPGEAGTDCTSRV